MEAKTQPFKHAGNFKKVDLSLRYSDLNAIDFPDWVDIEFILSTNPGLAELLVDSKDFLSELNEFQLIQHIIDLSGKPDLLLNKWFDVHEYERIRPDVMQASVNSTIHYFSTNGPRLYPELNGENFNIINYIEKKKINAAMSHSFDKDEVLKSWSIPDQNFKIDRSCVLLDKISQLGKKKLVISLSHDDAFSNLGGIQKIIRQENIDSLSRKDICYVHICPVQAAPFSVDFLKKTQTISRITVNGLFAGNYLIRSVFNSILRDFRDDNLYLFIHHFFGFPLETIYHFAFNVAKKINA